MLPESISQISKVLDTEEQVKNEEEGIEPVQTMEEKAEPGKNEEEGTEPGKTEEEGTEPGKTEEEGKEERRPSFTSSVTVNVRRLFFYFSLHDFKPQTKCRHSTPTPQFLCCIIK